VTSRLRPISTSCSCTARARHSTQHISRRRRVWRKWRESLHRHWIRTNRKTLHHRASCGEHIEGVDHQNNPNGRDRCSSTSSRWCFRAPATAPSYSWEQPGKAALEIRFLRSPIFDWRHFRKGCLYRRRLPRSACCYSSSRDPEPARTVERLLIASEALTPPLTRMLVDEEGDTARTS